MEEMYGLMNYHHHQVTQPADHHAYFDDEQPREARQQQQQQQQLVVDPVLFGSGSNTRYKNNNKITNGLADGQQLEEEDFSSANRAKIMSHPLYPKLLQAYISCQKVGAPPDIAKLFDEIFRDNDFCTRSSNNNACSCLGDDPELDELFMVGASPDIAKLFDEILRDNDLCTRSSNNACSCLGDDPELDEFMETYCEMLDRYRSDLARPFDEATMFLSNMQSQLTNLCKGATTTCITSDESVERSLEEDTSNKQQGEADVLKNTNSRGTNEDRDLKDRLLRKYSKYISSLKHAFSNKKKKKGKLPKEARQVLLDWWNVHYMWPYPTEAEKIALAESSGLDQKQINYWFINQRTRHWKQSENTQFAVMDNLCGSFIINS